MARLLERADADGIVRLPARSQPQPASRILSPGARVAIAAGPLAGFNGLYAGQTAHERELILIDLLGRQTPVAIAAGLVVPSQ